MGICTVQAPIAIGLLRSPRQLYPGFYSFIAKSNGHFALSSEPPLS